MRFEDEVSLDQEKLKRMAGDPGPDKLHQVRDSVNQEWGAL